MIGILQNGVQASLQSGKLHRWVEQADFRFPVYLVAGEHHTQQHFQQGVRKETRQLEHCWYVGVRSGPRGPEVLLVERRCPNVKWRSGHVACPMLVDAAISDTVQPPKMNALVQAMFYRECLGLGWGVMAAAFPVTSEHW